MRLRVWEDFAAIFHSNRLPDGALWPMFLLANVFISYFGPLECTALAWLPVAVLRDPATRDRAREFILAEGTALFLLAAMVNTQLCNEMGAHYVIRLTRLRKACLECHLSNQRVWLGTMAELIQLDPAAHGLRDAPCHGTCDTIKTPILAMVRLLLRADLDGFLDVLTGGGPDASSVPICIWRAVGKGALDGIKDAEGIADYVTDVYEVIEGDDQNALVREIWRVAPKAMASSGHLKLVPTPTND
ncbi:hypothetical protein H9P43_007186 [Blastocladiella emersonii ATCC 22665]|nr:hypothetical protein H9P43_007186 [Blastocladiella emersonii ATCC 22665]